MNRNDLKAVAMASIAVVYVTVAITTGRDGVLAVAATNAIVGILFLKGGKNGKEETEDNAEDGEATA